MVGRGLAALIHTVRFFFLIVISLSTMVFINIQNVVLHLWFQCGRGMIVCILYALDIYEINFELFYLRNVLSDNILRIAAWVILVWFSHYVTSSWGERIKLTRFCLTDAIFLYIHFSLLFRETFTNGTTVYRTTYEADFWKVFRNYFEYVLICSSCRCCRY